MIDDNMLLCNAEMRRTYGVKGDLMEIAISHFCHGYRLCCDMTYDISLPDYSKAKGL